MIRVEIREYISKKPNGDRDTNRHDCSKFEVWMVEDAQPKDAFLASYHDCFEGFHCHVEPRGPALIKIRDYAARLASFLDSGIAIQHRTFREEVVTETRWVEKETL